MIKTKNNKIPRRIFQISAIAFGGITLLISLLAFLSFVVLFLGFVVFDLFSLLKGGGKLYDLFTLFYAFSFLAYAVLGLTPLAIFCLHKKKKWKLPRWSYLLISVGNILFLIIYIGLGMILANPGHW